MLDAARNSQRGRFLLRVLLLFLLALAPVVSAQGVLEGQVVNGTQGGPRDSVAGLTVTLYLLQEGKETSLTTVTDEEGRFHFLDLTFEEGTTYWLLVEYEGITYGSGAETLDEVSDPILLTVYETTRSDETIKVALDHLVVSFEPGALAVEEYYLFTNTGDRVYIGREDGTTLRFPLLPGADKIEFASQRVQANVLPWEEGVASTLPVAPGESEVSLTYSLPLEGPDYSFVRGLAYSTESFILLIEDIGAEVQSDQLTREGSAQGHILLAGEALVGEEVRVEITNIPQETARPASSSSPTLGLERVSPWLILVPVALGLALISGFGLTRGRAMRLPTGPDLTLEEERARLLKTMAELDDAYANGAIPEEGYRAQRAEKKARLLEIWRSEQ
ncbi:MAG: carboxypeptidase-like regulatory domain-containing protein [Anaerolineae bacterium]